MGVNPNSKDPLTKLSDPFGRGTLAVAPTDVDSEHNTIREPLMPIAAWELEDAHFAFDSSVLLPSMTSELGSLIALVRANPGAPIAIFGHADPVGQDGYNKLLSGRRATALFALLTRRVDLWEHLHQHPMGHDDWKKNELAVTVMQQLLDRQRGSGPPVAGSALFRAFMDAIGVDPDGKPFVVPAAGFLGQGADKGGKVDYQGCGEFNPVLMFSKREATDFAPPGRQTARDQANAPNRRVTVFVFPPGTKVNPVKWPCPRVNEGIGGCQKRFWSDAAVRRLHQEARREHAKEGDTFACRFYQRLAEPLGPRRTSRLILRLVTTAGVPLNDAEYRLSIGGRTLTAKTDGNGMISQPFPSSATNGLLEVAGWRVELTIADLPAPQLPPGARTRLQNLGFPATELNVALFQEDQGLPPHGKLDPPTVAKLVEHHGS